MKKLTHLDNSGKARMVDVGEKPLQVRIAKATGHIKLAKETLRLIRENLISKGDVFTVAEIAGIQGGKQTSSLIPLCHPLPISKIEVKAVPNRNGVTVTSLAKCTGRTGIEMEALTAVSIALLAVYDMCKAVDKGMVIDQIRLVDKIKKDLMTNDLMT